MAFDQRLALAAGLDIPIPECQVIIHQPRVKEIGMMGENDFNTGAQILCIDRNSFSEGQNLPIEVTNFNLLMSFLNEKEAADKKQTVKAVLALVLPDYQIILTPRSILCNKDNENLIIDEGNFDNFQKILKKIFQLDRKQKDKNGEIREVYNPANEKAKQIAEKIYKGRKKLAELKSSQNPDDSALARYFSILAIGLGYTSDELNNLTLFQINDLFERFTLKMKQDMDISMRLAGGKPEEQPDHWMGPLH